MAFLDKDLQVISREIANSFNCKVRFLILVHGRTLVIIEINGECVHF